MLKEYQFGKEGSYLHQSKFSSMSLGMPIVSHVNYVLTLDVKRITLTQSISNVGSKMLVLITNTNQLYSI